MERRRSTAVVLAVSFLFLIFGLGCTAIGIFGEGWWIEHFDGGGKIEDGILIYCEKLKDQEEEHCGYYSKLFSFIGYEGEKGRRGEHRDVVLLCLCAGCGCAVLAFITFFIAACMIVKMWECVTSLNTLSVSMGAVLCMTGMIYTEVKFKNVWESLNSDRKDCWSYILAWIGAVLLLISAIFSFISIFLKPRETYKMKDLSSPTGARSTRLPRTPQTKTKSNPPPRNFVFNGKHSPSRTPISRVRSSPGVRIVASKRNVSPPKSPVMKPEPPRVPQINVAFQNDNSINRGRSTSPSNDTPGSSRNLHSVQPGPSRSSKFTSSSNAAFQNDDGHEKSNPLSVETRNASKIHKAEVQPGLSKKSPIKSSTNLAYQNQNKNLVNPSTSQQLKRISSHSRNPTSKRNSTISNRKSSTSEGDSSRINNHDNSTSNLSNNSKSKVNQDFENNNNNYFPTYPEEPTTNLDVVVVDETERPSAVQKQRHHQQYEKKRHLNAMPESSL